MIKIFILIFLSLVLNNCSFNTNSKFWNEENKDKIKVIEQKIYDFIFMQIELSLREIGHGDVTINKRMKTYINLFYSIIDKIDTWEKIEYDKKTIIFSEYIGVNGDFDFIINYFEKYRQFLKNNTLNYFTKDVISLNF